MSQDADFSSEPLDPDEGTADAGADPRDQSPDARTEDPSDGSDTERGAEEIMEQVGHGFDAAIEGEDPDEARGT
jgi:hypothetical protein